MAKSRTITERKSLVDVKVLFRDNYVKKNNAIGVYLYIYLKRKKVVLNTQVFVKKEFWDYEKQMVKRSHPDQSDLNQIIDTCKSRINDIFVRYRLENLEITPELLKKEFKAPTLYIDFYSFMENAIKDYNDNLESSTVRQHRAVLSKLKAYKKTLMFSQIDEQFIRGFDAHLKRKKNEPWTRYNNLSKFRAYLNLAVKQKIIKENPFKDFKMTRPVNDREFLSEDELNALIVLYKKEYFPTTYHKTLRHYLFSCFTSLAISDLRALRMEQIIVNMLVYTRIKTRNKKPVSIKIPLCKMAKKLINDESPNRLKGEIFDMWTDQTINRQLKDIVKVAKINKEITFHTARHTFATIFLRRTKNIVALGELLGHSDINTTMIYSHLLTEDLEKEMKCFDDILSSY